jgi:TonB family protein
MMEKYRREQERQLKNSRVAGGALSLFMGLISFLLLEYRGMTYLDPPPPDDSPITLDFTEQEKEPVKPKQQWNGTRPTVENPDPQKKVELVKHSEAPEQGTKENLAEATTVDDFGDVEKTEPEQKVEINKKALFSAAQNKAQKDTLAPQTSSKPSDELEDGHASGNIKDGNTAGAPNAKLAGRTVIGALPQPYYNVQESGKVVVRIKVDREGTVVEAQPGAEGTNFTNKTAWDAAKKAALKAQFNIKADAPEFQYGTITYIFNITQ